MIDLKNTTFLIPLMIDTMDRYRNITILLRYLNNNFNTNIIIYEKINKNKSEIANLLSNYTNLNIKYISESKSNIFHRTKYLNIMLNMVDTPVVVNYDTDILLPVDSYINAQNMIIENNADVVYPFDTKKDSLFRVNIIGVRDTNSFINFPTIDNLNRYSIKYFTSTRGFCIFFNTDVYREGGGENENFISWGPEDEERYIRFSKLGYNVVSFENEYVYHLEHYRTKDSSKRNPYFNHNDNIFNKIKEMDKLELLDYLKKQKYLDKYNSYKK